MSALPRCGNGGIRPFPVATTERMAAASNRGAPAAMLFGGSAVS